MIPFDAVHKLLVEAFPGDEILLSDDGQDGEHYSLVVVSQRFEAVSMVKQHKMVYDALGTVVGAELHALALRTYTPQQWKSAVDQNKS